MKMTVCDTNLVTSIRDLYVFIPNKTDRRVEWINLNFLFFSFLFFSFLFFSFLFFSFSNADV